MEPIDFVRAKIKAAGIRTAGLISLCEKIDKNRDGIVHFDDIDNILSEKMGKTDQLSRREVRVLMLALSDATERGEVQYKRLYDVLDVKKKDDAASEEWLNENGDQDHSTGGLLYSRRTLPLAHGPATTTSIRSSSNHKIVQNRVSNNFNMIPGERPTYVPRESLGDFLRKLGPSMEATNFKTFIHALEKYERDSGMRIEDSPNGFVVPLGPDLSVNIEFRSL